MATFITLCVNNIFSTIIYSRFCVIFTIFRKTRGTVSSVVFSDDLKLKNIIMSGLYFDNFSTETIFQYTLETRKFDDKFHIVTFSWSTRLYLWRKIHSSKSGLYIKYQKILKKCFLCTICIVITLEFLTTHWCVIYRYRVKTSSRWRKALSNDFLFNRECF